ncbi:hypothetical protein HMPREF9141_1831 [Prevotella multiformis DSM 16608]|uniref:Uncharacterized protein n=1 Tax=Prevotella multiformis DSM 16608 TaxID=888743 RepID=F0F8B4_9BACT|nr:hypothetical protein HMPREF9141_1831 [Prevotella multiformis DSM 16608]
MAGRAIGKRKQNTPYESRKTPGADEPPLRNRPTRKFKHTPVMKAGREIQPLRQ